RHLGHNRAWHQRLRDDPRLVVERPEPPTAGPVDHLKAMNLPFRLKRKVKSRHKPISDPKTESEISQISCHPERCPRHDAYTITTLGKIMVENVRRCDRRPVIAAC